MSNALNSPQLNNGLARQFFLNYDDITLTSSPDYQTDKLFMAFYQNKQATSDLTTWNSWVNSPTGGIPAATDDTYPLYFNLDQESWRNKILFLAPLTRIEMVEKDIAGSISYNGQKWSPIASYDEREATVGSEPRYIYFESDLKYYDSALTVCSGITDKSLVTGLGLYKTELKSDGTSETADFTTGGLWSDVNYDSGDSAYVYKNNSAINSAGGSTRYDPDILIASKLIYLYQNTFVGTTRTDTLNTKFSLIIEF